MRRMLHLLAVFIVSVVLFETIIYVTSTPRPQPEFFELYALGENGTATDYYPNGTSYLPLGRPVRWYLQLTDHTGSVQLVAILVKLGNRTINAPNDTRSLPSPAPLVTEFSRFVQDNETWETPFIWQIMNISATGDLIRILELQINNETYYVNSSAENGLDFRAIFELWTWNTDLVNFEYGWWAGNEHRVAWLQLWFNATIPSP